MAEEAGVQKVLCIGIVVCGNGKAFNGKYI
jgi:hypothetical protein